jgi:uncharacterized phage protein (TIGR02220 family)
MAKGSSMGRDPGVTWVFNDWAGGTAAMTRHQKGCYMDLLTAQFNLGHLSLEQIKNVLGADFGPQWLSMLKSKFNEDADGRFFNERLEFEILKRKGFNASRRNNLSGEKVEPHMGIGKGKVSEEDIRSVLDHFNLTARAKFKTDADSNRKHVRARLREGFTTEDCQLVIDHKVATWGPDAKMKEYLRPQTLFSSNFESYLEAAKRPTVGKVETALIKHQEAHNDIDAKYGIRK